MKLVIVTVVKEFEKEIPELFKQANIDSFSEGAIDGYKNTNALFRASNWFPSEKGGVQSSLLFSFTEEDKIEVLFGLIKTFNANLETTNPIRAVVVPVEKYI
ncbi:hypothetical protein [Maribacter sp.]|uniref:hypothetical protein n=1 Tax=Maribacter sp. TaxID=1897614 RepID=UPI0025C4D599|nr:hypothetical protein [Maribacter sp.]